MIDVISSAWGWIEITPTTVVDINKFGNIIFMDTAKHFWRICPEELSCVVIAETQSEYSDLIKDEEFLVDWHSTVLVELAEAAYGPQIDGRCFCLKIPAVLGGAYTIDNIGTISLNELISFSGNVAKQIKS